MSKTIHWIRHGQSTANAAQMEAIALEADRTTNSEDNDRDGYDPLKMKEEMFKIMDQHPDAELTDQGREEALETRRMMECKAVELVICSSLCRAMETAALVFPHTKGIIVLDEMREFAGPPLSEKRHSIQQLKSHLPQRLGIPFERFDFSFIHSDEDQLWAPREEKGQSARARASVVLDFLLQRSESSIACVGHTNFLRQCLLGRANREVKVVGSSDGKHQLVDHFGNAEVRSVRLSHATEADRAASEKGKVPPRFVLTPLVEAASKL